MEIVFRFAGFEADRERYQLRHGGRPLKLEHIPLELLFLLLEHAGKLVSRQQMVARLWGDNVFLDTERSINTAIRKVRKALGDDPHHPQFIETVVGKGYRFIAPFIAANHPRNPRPEIQPDVQSAANRTHQDGAEILLRGFSVETPGGVPVLTCDVVVSNIALGRLPLMELELPADVTLPLKAEDRLLLKLHGVRVTLTAKANQALQAFSISVLGSGLRTRVTDFILLNEEPPRKRAFADADPEAGQFCSPEAAATQQQP